MFYRSILHNKQFKYLGAFYLHSLIRLFAISIFQFFSSIFVYQILISFGFNQPQSLALTSLFFALIFAIQALAVAPALWIIDVKGLRFSVFWGNIILIGFLAFLYLAKFDPIILIVAAILGGLQIAFYWTAYHIYLVELSDDPSQGKEIAAGQALSALATIGGPAFGGLIINFFGFGAIFIMMSLTLVLAIIPLRYLPTRKNLVSIDIIKTVTAFSPKTEQRSYLSLFAAGIIDIVATGFWPLFIFPIMAGFAGLGFVGSLIAFVGMLSSLATGFLVDKSGAKKLLNFLSPLDSLVWVYKLFVYTPFQAYIASAAQAITTSGQLLTLDAIIYERARHTDVAAFIVQREIGLSVGKFLLLVIVGMFFWFGMPFKVVFILAAIAALFTRLYPVENLKNLTGVKPLALKELLAIPDKSKTKEE